MGALVVGLSSGEGRVFERGCLLEEIRTVLVSPTAILVSKDYKRKRSCRVGSH